MPSATFIITPPATGSQRLCVTGAPASKAVMAVTTLHQVGCACSTRSPPGRSINSTRRDPLQRLEEGDQPILIRRAEPLVVVRHEGRLARVAQDRVVERERRPVVHVAIVRAHAPER